MRLGKRRKKSRGFLYITALLMMASLLSLGAVGLTRSTTELVASNRLVAKYQAFQFAEGRLDDILERLKTAPDSIFFQDADNDGVLDFTDTNGDGFPDLTCPGSFQYSSCTLVDITPNPTPFGVQSGIRQLQVTTTGSQAGVMQTIQSVVEVPSPSIFPPGILAGWVLMGFGTNLVDAYDSCSGAYPYTGWAWNQPRPVSATVQATTSINIQQYGFWNPSWFWNNMIVGAGVSPATVTYWPGAVPSLVNVQGTQKAASQNIPLPPITLPPGNATGSPYVAGDCSPSDPPTVFQIGVNMPSMISTGNNCKIIVQGDGLVHLDELSLPNSSSSIEFQGNATVVTNVPGVQFQGVVKIASTGSLSLYINGTNPVMTAVSASYLNNTMDPKKFTLYVKNLSTSIGAVDLPSVSTVYGAIYAPNAYIWGHTGVEVYGSLVSGQMVTMDGHSKMHGDTALKYGCGGGGGGPSPLTMLSWQQL